MAKPFTLRELAQSYQLQADIFEKLAKKQDTAARQLPRSNQATIPELQAAAAAFDLSVRYYYTHEGFQQQADAANAAADAANEPPLGA